MTKKKTNKSVEKQTEEKVEEKKEVAKEMKIEYPLTLNYEGYYEVITRADDEKTRTEYLNNPKKFNEVIVDSVTPGDLPDMVHIFVRDEEYRKAK